jgi:DNA-binding GntR family transcriptional regulator
MNELPDIAQVCRDIEDHLVPYLLLGAGERALYYHLLRHSRADGKRHVRVSKRGLARSFGTSSTTVSLHLRSLAQKGCVRILDRSLAGHIVEVLTPDEIPGCLHPDAAAEAAQVEDADCLRSERLRGAILRRERYACFYCLRQVRAGAAAFDHAMPASAGGDNSYRNIVACCFDCNSRKRDRSAEEFLRELYRASRLSNGELDARLAAVEALRAGELVPKLRLTLDPMPSGDSLDASLSKSADPNADPEVAGALASPRDK